MLCCFHAAREVRGNDRRQHMASGLLWSVALVPQGPHHLQPQPHPNPWTTQATLKRVSTYSPKGRVITGPGGRGGGGGGGTAATK